MNFALSHARPAKLASRALLGAVLTFGCTVPLNAAESPGGSAPPSEGPKADWIVSFGVMAGYGPRYRGAGRYGFFGVPSVGFRRADEPIPFSAPEDSLDYTLFSTPSLKVGAVANLRGGKNAGIDHRLAGLDRDPWTLEAGAFIDFWPIPGVLRTRTEIRHGLRQHDGFVADLSSDLVEKIGPFTLSGGPRLSIVGARLAQIEFGVSAAASAKNGLVPPYTAHVGVQSIGYGLTLDYDWSEQWRTTLFHHYDRLVGDAANSPITRRFGSADQFTFGLGFTYSFNTGFHLF